MQSALKHISRYFRDLGESREPASAKTKLGLFYFLTKASPSSLSQLRYRSSEGWAWFSFMPLIQKPTLSALYLRDMFLFRLHIYLFKL